MTLTSLKINHRSVLKFGKISWFKLTRYVCIATRRLSINHCFWMKGEPCPSAILFSSRSERSPMAHYFESWNDAVQATLRKKGPSWPALKVEGIKSYVPATTYIKLQSDMKIWKPKNRKREWKVSFKEMQFMDYCQASSHWNCKYVKVIKNHILMV